ncbi:TetR/AcrR family transcriptional regulator [Streptomyces sp. NPDC096310]|uniref:TetR/AcrR family transcriptional regulator n=1 Tax=Streptomyces sp. NPDC096310 TaxID=3366082 RepID=UPI003827D72F
MRTTSPRLTARERILNTACELFYTHGIRAVGVDRVIAESGAAKSTLYVHFPAKDDLIAAYLRRWDDKWRGQLRAAALQAGDTPRVQLIGVFDALNPSLEEQWYRGCPFINAAAEFEPGTVPHAVAREHKQAVRAWIRELAHAAGADDPDGLARQLTLVIDGALANERVERSCAVAAGAREVARLLIERSCPPD